ncbi:hypothetical protein G647_07413 [Cladophialophora carrionii CBS 160.54]|uniref:AAA+ ATPase domain-containing protein n=1 Tax=Cladophialophora carrionii CBS 160.54 TaxID=1279043 RepID=V9D2B6_9EURO|nr:uncharacterized protein G647_07413 [Cladophialophora carrionii CBS 160.54]ETI21069.1 hypothetical protein G647_07413 [Cladophialophora carrionii CBS 160.54]
MTVKPEDIPSPSTVGVGLDGISEDEVLHSAHTDATTDSRADRSNLADQSASGVANTQPGSRWSVIEGDDLERENMRVKRRRVSVEPVSSGLDTANTPQSTSHEQLQDAARTLVEPQQDEFENQISMCHYPPQIKESEVSKSRETMSEPPYSPHPSLNASSTTNEIDSHQPLLDQLPQTDGAMDDPPLKRIKPSSTPSNKKLRSEHGKLSFSPKKPPRSGTVQQDSETNGSKKPAKASKKVEMKNGRFVSSLRVSLPYTAPDSGARIDEILSSKHTRFNTEIEAQRATEAASKPAAAKTTHPFFLGKTAVKTQKQQSDLKSESSSVIITSDDETGTRPIPKASKPWKDIVFGSGKLSKQIASLLPSIWPPASLQHVRPGHSSQTLLPTSAPASRSSSKLKHNALRVRPEEDILWNFSRSAVSDAGTSNLHMPRRRVMSGKFFSETVDSLLETCNNQKPYPNPLISLRTRIQSTPSCFDKGTAAGPQIWSHEYAPARWQDVLESQSKVLHDWLNSLRVHQVQTGGSQKANPSVAKKLRRKRKSEEMEDFIAESDDDDARSTANGKNAILLVGPPGSGKTASIFAVALQLGFEVFEINPGMRRSARDIQDKVGDMTHNHLVQQSSPLSRESSISIDDETRFIHEPPPINQKTMAAFMNAGAAKNGKQQKLPGPKESKDSRVKSQKQSLILFEEVDILFEEDKGFWSHVIWLIKTSKRPVILTCNDIESVPRDELDLFTVLRYGRPEMDLAIQHLGHIAAAEGHLLSKEALKNLYLTKGQDLRAAITELNLWCQMTVGSLQGGLDWMLSYQDRQRSGFDGAITRIISQDTYISGLDLLPEQIEDTEDLIRFTQASLGISPLDWVEEDIYPFDAETTPTQTLTDAAILSDAKSAMDLFDDRTAPLLAGVIKSLSTSAHNTPPVPRDEVVRLYLNQLPSSRSKLTRTTIASTLEPLLEESRIGLPTGLGRKSPSLDNPSAVSVITEVAPYIRCIVSHDKHLEYLRNELHGVSQTGPTKRQRRTRASRAAMEGGDKGTTRRDKWFPEQLDWDAVLGTGNSWPMARDDDYLVTTRGEEEGSRSDMGSKEQTPSPVPSGSMDKATDTEVEV